LPISASTRRRTRAKSESLLAHNDGLNDGLVVSVIDVALVL
jgi:hypothetical protein